MIYGKKVVIRPLQLGDETALYAWWSRGDFMAHAGLGYGTLESLDKIRSDLQKETLSANLHSSSRRFLILDREDNQPIGEISYSQWDKRNQKAQFGLKIGEEAYQGKGYGYDALVHFITFMFHELHLNKIELTTMEDNNRAHGLYHKLGFKSIGTIRDGYFHSGTGKFANVLYMDLLKEDWFSDKR